MTEHRTDEPHAWVLMAKHRHVPRGHICVHYRCGCGAHKHEIEEVPDGTD